MTVFTITKEQQAKIDEWTKEVFARVIEKQKAGNYDNNHFAISDWKLGYPYSGAIGVDITYKFTPTSLGEIVSVECYGETLDVTNYTDW